MLNIRQLIAVSILFSSLIFAPVVSSQDQDDLQPVTNIAVSPHGMIWSSDSSTLFFESLSRVWYSYHLDVDVLVELESHPLAFDVTDETLAHLNPAIDEDGRVSLAFPSPDGRYLAYGYNDPSVVDYATFFPLAIANLETGEVQVTETGVLATRSTTHWFDVLWNEESTGFAVLHWGLYAYGFYYFQGVDKELNNIIVQRLDNWREEISEGVVTFMFDTSNDRVVMQYDGTKLVIWSPLRDEIVVIDNNYSVNDAIFLDDNTIRYTDESGVYDLDLETEEKILVTDHVQPDRADRTYISPDGCRVALADTNGTYGPGDSLYLFNLCES